MMCKACHSIEEVPCCFHGLPWNFQVTQFQKSTIWIQFEVGILGRSQLSNPSELSLILPHSITKSIIDLYIIAMASMIFLIVQTLPHITFS